MEEVFDVLPKKISEMILSYNVLKDLEEIRVRVCRPLELIAKGKPIFLAYQCTTEDATYILNKLSQFSIYMMEEELKRGFVTIKGGHRVGLAGKVITENSKVKIIRDVTSFNIRIAKEKKGSARSLIPYIYDMGWKNTMIIGAPQTGKTTILRDIARIMSEGIKEQNLMSCKVGVVDERSEIAGCVKGVPQFTFGPRIDVLDACPKAEGMMMMIRSMSPDIVIADEIGRLEDSEAIIEATHGGVQVMVTAHGYSLKDIQSRPTMRELLSNKVFERFIILSRENGPGTISQILNSDGKDMRKNVVV